MATIRNPNTVGTSVIALLTMFIVLTLTFNVSLGGDLQWDELKFTQEWGFTACRQFKDKSPEKKCRFEGQPSIWSVHGIWPTKEGSEGPNFCKKIHFDINALTPIVKDLNQFWYEIDESRDAHHFWEHEWLKHGSCAMELDTFNTELKYFGEGLSLRTKLDLYSILKSGGIIPSATQGYKLNDIHSAFQKAIGSQSAVPYVQCLKTKSETGSGFEYHLLAVEICLDPNLQVLDCRAKKRSSILKGDQPGPCPADEPILYNDYTPGTQKIEKSEEL